MPETATQFAWRTLGLGDYPPPVPKRGEPFGPDAVCWLCGGATDGVGWPWRQAIPETYTNHTLAVCPTSTTVCQPCAALGSKTTWEQYVAGRPDSGLKTGHAMSWRCYSHVFSVVAHECPSRARWRSVLLEPPEPPFLLVVATSGQKHLIFRARVAHSREAFPVQFEEQSVWLDRPRFARCLADVEAMLALGFSREGVLTGRYHPAQLLKIGPARWSAGEEAIRTWRQTAPLLLQLAVHVAQREEDTP